MAIVRASFRPEFLNRVDEIILFHRLQKPDMARIVDIQMVRLPGCSRSARSPSSSSRARGIGSPKKAGTRPTARVRSSA